MYTIKVTLFVQSQNNYSSKDRKDCLSSGVENSYSDMYGYMTEQEWKNSEDDLESMPILQNVQKTDGKLVNK